MTLLAHRIEMFSVGRAGRVNAAGLSAVSGVAGLSLAETVPAALQQPLFKGSLAA